MSAHHSHVIRNVFVDMLDSIYAVLNSKLSRTLPHFIIKRNFPFSNFHTSKILSQNMLLSLPFSLCTKSYAFSHLLSFSLRVFIAKISMLSPKNRPTSVQSPTSFILNCIIQTMYSIDRYMYIIPLVYVLYK